MRRKQKHKRKLRPGTFLFILFVLMLLAAFIYAGNQFRREVGEMAEYRSKIAAVKVVNDSIMAVSYTHLETPLSDDALPVFPAAAICLKSALVPSI